MLSNLASYLGYPSAAAETESEADDGVNMRLSAVEEDEWLLVERQKPGEVTLAVTTSPSALPGARPSPMQESWYLTPPPAFTSRGPVHMETSPLENLLIEHPSMSVYHKSAPVGRKTMHSSPTASDEEAPLKPSSSEGSTPVWVKTLPKLKYSKKTSVKRVPTSSSDDALSLPSTSEDDETKEVKVKNFVKSPRRIIVSKNEDVSPAIGTLVIKPFSPPRMLYSDVLRRSKPQPAITVTAPRPEPASVVVKAVVQTAVGETAPVVEAPEASMVVEDGVVAETGERRPVQALPTQHRQHFLNWSAQKLEQRKTCETAKRNTMGRNNKAREINSRNKRQRRSDMMQRHSGANNNRKCC